MSIANVAILDDLVIIVANRMRRRRGDRGGYGDLAEIPDSAHREYSRYNKIIGNIPGWANVRTAVTIGSDFRAGKSYDPQEGSPGSGYYSPYNSLELVSRYSGIKIYSIAEFISPKITDPVKREQVTRAWESMYGAMYQPGGNGYDPFIVVPSRYLEDKSSWDQFAITAHETGHSIMMANTPGPLKRPLLHLVVPRTAAIGNWLSIAGYVSGEARGLEDKTLFRRLSGIGKFGAGLSILGSTGMLASETWANVFASRRLRQENAPGAAYEAIKGSEKSYIGLAMLYSSIGMGSLATIRNSRAGKIGALTGAIVGMAINTSGINQLRNSNDVLVASVTAKKMASKNKHQLHNTSSKMGTASSKAAKFSNEVISKLKEQEMSRV